MFSLLSKEELSVVPWVAGQKNKDNNKKEMKKTPTLTPAHGQRPID